MEDLHKARTTSLRSLSLLWGCEGGGAWTYQPPRIGSEQHDICIKVLVTILDLLVSHSITLQQALSEFRDRKCVDSTYHEGLKPSEAPVGALAQSQLPWGCHGHPSLCISWCLQWQWQHTCLLAAFAHDQESRIDSALMPHLYVHRIQELTTPH